ncbi:hypothetical protein [Wolbachia endosymbiont (group A) of Sphaerophoria taeniata]|uniref:hypothetical protein n=1 Tax=Wolbachia endosymbiont (group A) of Sphaerophoria taeniata TaxID=2954057 RepID=UPI0022275326|nr:hypothetical protein [Wolbachia endosymbiont (group A) of Sphaerophoria taeniata]
MVESFLGKNKGSNFIEGTKIMKNFSDNNKNGSSIFQGKIREQDFSAEQKLNELKAAVEELTRQDLLRRLECERQDSSCIDEISSQAELHIGQDDDEGYFNCERTLWNFFEPLFNLFEVNVDDPKIYQMLKEKKEKNWLLSIIKFMRDKLKELIKKIFARDLSFNQRLDKEIKELQEKLGSGELSGEELARVLERLQTLQDLKLKLQLAVTGWIITMFAEMFGVELAAIVEASTEETNKAEDKKAKKTSLEATKEVHKDVEIKMDEREKPAVPVSLFEVSPGFVRPVVLNKPELEIVSDPLKHLLRLTQLERKSHENSQKPEKVNEEKKAKPEEPKKEVCPPKPAEKKPVVRGIKFYSLDKDINFEKWDTNTSVNGRGTTSTNKCGTTNDFKEKELNPTNEKKFDGKESKSTDKQKTDDPYAKLAKKVAERDTQRKESDTIKHDYPIDTWQAPSGTTDNGKSSASSASDAKENPKSKVTDVLNERAARGNGNTPSR